MTTIERPNQIWNSMPGWGISANLIPPEVVASRRLKVLRKSMAAALVIVLLACVAGYLYAARARSSASDALVAEQAHTSELQVAASKYAGLTTMEVTTTAIRAQIATLMAGDVDLVKLMSEIRQLLPATMTINQEALTVNSGGGASSKVAPTTGLDTSGQTPIGVVTIAGTSVRLTDLAVYVDRLATLRGVIDVVPTSNVAGTTGVQYSLTFGFTDKLISHRFDVSKTGGK